MTFSQVTVTLDIDWAPDFVIDFAADYLIRSEVRATWFVTHASPAIQRLRSRPDLFELGIHPNFLPSSSHGRTPEEILATTIQLVPEAVSMRTHALVQSTPLLEKVTQGTSIKYDISLFLPYVPDLRPFEYRWKNRSLIRIPYYWEDDYEWEQREPNWRLKEKLGKQGGLRIFNFHPLHIYMNSASGTAYAALRRCVASLAEVTRSDIDSCIQRGEGTRTLFAELVEYLSTRSTQFCVSDIGKSAICNS